MPKKSKARDILETIFYTILSLAIVGGLVFGLIQMGLMSLFVICPVLIFVVLIIVLIKRDKKKKDEYNLKYVNKTVIEDSFFGSLECAIDISKNEILCESSSVPFGDYNPKIEITDYNQANNEFYFRSLEFVYERHDEIIEKLLNGFLESYSNSKKITREMLETNFSIERISISKRDEYFLAEAYVYDGEDIDDGSPEDWVAIIESGLNKDNQHNNFVASVPVAYVDLKTKKMCWAMEE